MKKKLISLAIGAALLASNTAHADLFDLNTNIPLYINGFATAMGAFSNINQPYQQPEFGQVNNYFAMNGSLAGIQATADLTKNFSVTAQLVATYNKDFSAEATWAFAKYKLNNNWSIAAGRFRTPVYMFSQTFQVGNSYLWINPPESIYYMVPFYNMNGGFVTFNDNLNNNWSVNAELFGGQTRTTLTIPLGPASFTGKGIIGGKLALTNDIVTLEASAMSLHFDLATLPQLSTAGPTNDAYGNFVGLGAKVNYHHMIMIGEVGQRHVSGTLPAYRGGYLTLGYNMNKWTPSLTYSKIITTNNSKRTSLVNLVGYDPFNANQSSITAGVRYDINSNIDLKASIQRIDTHGTFGFFNGFNGTNTLIPTATAPTKAVYIGRFAIDVTF